MGHRVQRISVLDNKNLSESELFGSKYYRIEGEL
mgnify:CR=1 FL=1|jgi:hypothetical protein